MTAPSTETPDRLAATLGHRFGQPELLAAALSHPSLGEKGGSGYERLEFLGDRVLALCVADLLYRRYPAEDEGQLSSRLIALVRREALAGVATDIGLAQHVRVAPGALAPTGKARETLLSDACEAVIGALFLDGGLDTARQFVYRHWEARLEAVRPPPLDAKTALQEWLQGRGQPLPVYKVVGQEGPAHAPRFAVTAMAADGRSAVADGPNKRAAEQVAAARLLEMLERSDE
jgi:ribonuclease-3